MIASLQKMFPVEGVTFSADANDLVYIKIENQLATATLSTHGAHVMGYTPKGERPVLWMSRHSQFAKDKPIRGGVPICWPWFGPSPVDGRPAHGLARISTWEITSVEKLVDGSTRITLSLDDEFADESLCDFPFELEFSVTVGSTLEMTLSMLNVSDVPFRVSGALHTYFNISSADKITVYGVEQTPYVDKVDDGREVPSSGTPLIIDREIDRVYLPTAATIEVDDHGFGRRLRIEKSGSLSTVIWNPWTAKSAAMPDFGDEEYHNMLCVETANALGDSRVLTPGVPHVLTQKVAVI